MSENWGCHGEQGSEEGKKGNSDEGAVMALSYDFDEGHSFTVASGNGAKGVQHLLEEWFWCH